MNNTAVQLIHPSTKIGNSKSEAFFERVLDYDQILIFSPHLDDTILSMGGLLTELVKKHPDIVNYNIYTQCSFVSTDSTNLRLKLAGFTDWQKYCSMRQAEDQQAFEKLSGVTVHDLGFIDSLWRYNEKKQLLYQVAISELHAEDTHVDELTAIVKDLIKKPKTLVFCPLARGRHIDHVIIRDILTSLDVDVVYYMDFPYSQRYANETEFIEKNSLDTVEWPGPYEKKAELLQCYASQHQSLFTPSPFPLEYEEFYFPARWNIKDI